MKFKLFALLVLVSIIVTACGGGATQAPASNQMPATESPAVTEMSAMTEAPQAMGGEGEVAIVAWPGYIERGANDSAYDWVTKFEEETGCKVTVKDAATSDEMVQLMNSGGFDLVTASGDASLRLVYGGTVQEVDINKIPSYKNVDPRLGIRWTESITACHISGDQMY